MFDPLPLASREPPPGAFAPQNHQHHFEAQSLSNQNSKVMSEIFTITQMEVATEMVHWASVNATKRALEEVGITKKIITLAQVCHL